MGYSLSIICILLSAMVTNVTGGAAWTYNGTDGPEKWYINYPNCSGVKQSPINIVTTDVFVNSTLLTPIIFKNYNQSMTKGTYTMVNNGHTVQIDVTDNYTEITGSGLPGTYVTKQFHFHWGKIDERGSEHLIDGKHFPMEMHVVHYNKKYGSFDNALNQTLDGLAVLGILFELGGNKSAIEILTDHFANISYNGESVSIDAFPLEWLFPDDLGMFYRYEGSLTTPPCYESVQWTVFNKTIQVTEDQLMMFREMLFENPVPTNATMNETEIDIYDDFRPVQCINARKVYASNESLKTYTAVPTSVTNCVYITTTSTGTPSTGTGTLSSCLMLLVMLCIVLCAHQRCL